MSLCLGQLAIINFVTRNFASAQTYFIQCLEIATELDAYRMKLDCNLYLAYISFNSSDWAKSRDYFNEAYFAARQCNEIKMSEQCLCNAGIASGNLLIEIPATVQLQHTFYKTGIDFSGSSLKMIHQIDSETDSQESDASYC